MICRTVDTGLSDDISKDSGLWKCLADEVWQEGCGPRPSSHRSESDTAPDLQPAVQNAEEPPCLPGSHEQAPHQGPLNQLGQCGNAKCSEGRAGRANGGADVPIRTMLIVKGGNSGNERRLQIKGLPDAEPEMDCCCRTLHWQSKLSPPPVRDGKRERERCRHLRIRHTSIAAYNYHVDDEGGLRVRGVSAGLISLDNGGEAAAALGQVRTKGVGDS
jgi:hypothetical protein